MNVDEYRVRLDAFSGPLDLMLFLIRRDEIDIYDIPIAEITAQYCQYVRLLEVVDPNSVGDFLVLAATLMEIKSRLLLPTPPPAEGEEPEDPRLELVRQLLEYKQYKDAAQELAERARERALRFSRMPVCGTQPTEIELQDVPVWELLEAFGKLMAATGRSLIAHEVVYDDTPVALHAADILDRLRHEPSLPMSAVFAGRTRTECIGLFLALLELIRQARVRVTQDRAMGEIYLHLVPGEPDEPAETVDDAATPTPADQSHSPVDSPPPDAVETYQEIENP